MSWLLIFREHRALWERCHDQERQITQLAEQLDRALLPVQVIVDQLKESVLIDQPWPDNKVPDGAWLTPAYLNIP